MWKNILFFGVVLVYPYIHCNEAPSFIQDLNNVVIKESQEVGSVVGTLKGSDPEGSPVHYGIQGTDFLSVDKNTGVVRLLKSLDREVNDSLRFEAILKDDLNGSGENDARVKSTIIIDDENDTPPKFLDTPYEVSVPEDSAVDSTIFNKIIVEDIDVIGDTLEVTCKPYEQFDTCDKFSLVTFNSNPRQFEGGLVLKNSLSYNEKQLYKLALIANDGVHNTSTSIEIRVQDVQNLPPVFQSSLTAIVEEDAPIGTHVITVQAKDGDRGNPRPIVYDLLSNPFDYFLLDGSSGVLRTAKPLNREQLVDTNGVLSLTVRAREVINGVTSNEDNESATTDVSITIRDVNDEIPRFNQKEYNVTIPENLPEGSPLPNLDMIVSDADIGDNSAYSIRLEDVSGVFSVEPSSGTGSSSVIIRLANGSLDYENQNHRKFILLVIAEETKTKSRLSSTSTITVEVSDVNDNAPTFENPTYTATVNESSLPGTLLTIITATDRDSDKNGAASIVYELMGDGAERFNVNRKTGAITVALCNSPGMKPCLDYETKKAYFLTYKATDVEGRGHTSSVPFKIVVDDGNDNPPIFTMKNYTVTIDEGAMKFEPVFYVKAEDVDKTSGITYSIAEENAKELFGIDSETGEIFIVNKDGVWRTNNSHVISFTVTANDGIFQSRARVNVQIIDVNNNEPIFMQESYSADILEDAQIGKVVTKVVAVDDDTGINAELIYRIEKGSFGAFNIDDDTGVITVSSALDYDTRKFYNMTVIAIDKGTPMHTGSTTVFINVLNTNDKNPYFKPISQHAEIPKDAEIGTKFYKMVAADPDINDTSVLNFAFSEPITAVDKNGKPVIDNDIYKDFFRIEKDTGELSVASVLRRDIAAVVTVTVIVTDTSAKHSQEGKGTVMINILDVNDTPPTFVSSWSPQHPYYIEQMQEELPVGASLGTFTAIDAGSDIHHYAIEPENEYFSVNETTGTISTRKRIDFEQVQSINFTLKAYDTGVPQLSARANIIVSIVNINDRSPLFEKTEYEAVVKENAPKGTPVLKVKAIDEDLDDFGKVRYDFKGSNVNDFIIDEQTGEIKVANSAALDHERIKDIILKVEASDLAPREERKSAIVPVHIKIEDVNDNAPVLIQHQYSQNILETIPYSPPSPIVQFRANDEDEKARLRYYIVNGNDEEAFLLDSSSGILYPKRSLLGIVKKFKLTVEVTDGKFTDKAVIEINVLNVNQHKPVFKEPSAANASVQIPENVEVNYLVVKVSAVDNDVGENGRVTYHLRVGSNDTQATEEFSIDENTGDLRTLMAFDREKKANYQLILVAKDHGTQTTYETLQFLNIVLKDIDDNKPMFPISADGTSDYKFTVNENNSPKMLIGKVHADDADDGENAKVYYYIIKGNENGLFSLDRRDGSISALTTLDREQNSSHEFYIKATNSIKYNSAANEIIAQGDPTIARVVVIVNDENDNAPHFLESVYYAGVDMKSKNGTRIAEVTAVDEDAGANGKFHYEIKASNLFRNGMNRSSGSLTPGPFSINAVGVVYTRESLLLHNQDRFELHILAVEDEPPRREAEIVLIVWVYEIQQLVRVVIGRPMHEVVETQVHTIVTELTNTTGYVVVVDAVTQHTEKNGRQRGDWCDLYLHMIDNYTQTIVPVDKVLNVIDSKYDYSMNYYINVLPAFIQSIEEPFELALAALVALAIVLIVGCIGVIILCCCFKHWIVLEPLDMKCDMLIKKPIIDDLSTTENPLWIEQKLKLYEEQELTMQVFCEPETNRLSTANTSERRGSDETSVVDNTYATIQHPGRRNSVNTMLSMGPGDYATLGGSVLPLDNNTSHSQQVIEVALGFQGCTFQVPDGPADTTELLRVRSELRMNKDGEPEFMSELM